MSDARVTFIESVAPQDRQRILQTLEHMRIRLVAGSGVLSCAGGQVLIYQLATLLQRLFDQVELIGSNQAKTCVALPGLNKRAFLPSLQSYLKSLRPIMPATAPGASHAFTVLIGPGDEVADLYLGSTGWSARVSFDAPTGVSGSKNVLGALAGGTLGAAEVFKCVFADQLTGQPSHQAYSFSLLEPHQQPGDEPHLPTAIALDATLCGCGSIGSAFVLGLLAIPQLTGTITLVDHGHYDTGNVYKYALLDHATAAQRGAKSVQLASLIHRHKPGMQVWDYEGTVNQYLASLPEDYVIPMALSAVDTRVARAHIQDMLPREIVNCAIEGTNVEVSVHGFNDGRACLACLGLNAPLETWEAIEIANQIGLSPERVKSLLEDNGALGSDDVMAMRQAARFTPDFLENMDDLIGEPVDTLYKRAAYSQAKLQPGGPAPVMVTTAFVSAMAGVLMLAELIKLSLPRFRHQAADNSFRLPMLGIPSDTRCQYPQDPQGWCLCHSSYRQSLYRQKYEGFTPWNGGERQCC